MLKPLATIVRGSGLSVGRSCNMVLLLFHDDEERLIDLSLLIIKLLFLYL